jgi:hypothetical protein
MGENGQRDHREQGRVEGARFRGASFLSKVLVMIESENLLPFWASQPMPVCVQSRSCVQSKTVQFTWPGMGPPENSKREKDEKLGY